MHRLNRENQQHRASGLNFLVTAIILWNTRYLERAIAVLRQTEDIPDHLLAHLSPLGWEHVNLTGDYVWRAVEQMTENELRVSAARSRRRNPVGRTRNVGFRLWRFHSERIGSLLKMLPQA